MIWLRRVLGVTGWAAFGLLYWAFAAPWFEEGWDPKTYDWTSDWTPAEPGEAFSVYDGLVTEILFSARDIKFYAYRWGPGHEFHILVQRPGRDEIERCVAGEPFTRSNIRIIRPGLGLAPKYYEVVLGRQATQSIKAGTPIQWDLL